MDQEQHQFMTIRRLPARLTAQQVAWLLGFQEQQIAILVSRGLLQPLGSPAPNAQKFFARATIQLLENDLKWLDKSSRKIGEYWRRKNARRSTSALALFEGGESDDAVSESEQAARRLHSQIPMKIQLEPAP